MSSHTLLLSTGRVLSYAEYGDSSGTPLFYFHGWPSSRIQAAPLDALARKLRLRIISPDRPGIGRSDFHSGRRLLDWPPVTQELAAALGVQRFHAMGVSGGGLYVLSLAHAMPERLLSANVISGAPSFHLISGEDALPFHYKSLLLLRRRHPAMLAHGLDIASQIAALSPDAWPYGWLLKQLLQPRDYLALVEHGRYRIIADGFRDAWNGHLDALLTDGEFYLRPMGFDPADISIPVNLWHGTADRNIPIALAQAMAAHLRHAVCRWVPGEGHFSLAMLHAPEIFSVMLASASAEVE